MNLILTGLRGSGKTTVGKAFAQDLGWEFVDLDRAITQKAGKEVKEIVQEQGWEGFRKIERETFAEVLQKDNRVIASGGGTLVQEQNMPLAQGNAVVLLEAPIEELAKRIESDEHTEGQRPSLTGTSSLKEDLKRTWMERESKYRHVAGITINANKPVEEIVQEIKNQLAM